MGRMGHHILEGRITFHLKYRKGRALESGLR
jgi:hypothetical protein